MTLKINNIRTLNRQKRTIVDIPFPFVKWAGGKRQILNQLDLYLPNSFNKYIEPFVGGGALFFYLLPKEAILIDNNSILINVYKVIRNNVEELIQSLKKHKYEKSYYYKIRNVERTEEFNQWTMIEKASRFIYLNKCCYNGLYRVNSKGEFNVPFGRYTNPNFCDKKNLRAVSLALKDVEIYEDSFERSLDFAAKGDFIYLDPPYHPISESSNFVSYTKENFGKDLQIKLYQVFKQLDEIGCKLMLSNSYNRFILDLYKDYKIITIYAKRAINSKAKRRGKIKEVLVLNEFK